MHRQTNVALCYTRHTLQLLLHNALQPPALLDVALILLHAMMHQTRCTRFSCMVMHMFIHMSTSKRTAASIDGMHWSRLCWACHKANTPGYLGGCCCWQCRKMMAAFRFIGGWTVALTLNLFLFIYFLVFGVGFGTWASIKNLVSQINTLGVFANCYQCSSIVASNKINGWSVAMWGLAARVVCNIYGNKQDFVPATGACQVLVKSIPDQVVHCGCTGNECTSTHQQAS